MARPTKYSDDLLDTICEQLSEGIPLAEICRGEGMPATSTVRDWMNGDVDGVDGGAVTLRIARARHLGFDALAAEALRIANTPCEGEITTDDGEKVTVRKEDMLGHRKLQVDTILKLLSKWDPKRYGDLIKLAGPDGEQPIATLALTGDLTPEQATQAYTKLLGE